MLDATRRSREPKLDDAPEREALVRCRVCAEIVARVADRTVIGPSDLHTFVNPQGQVFELVCFSRADGAVAVGQPRLEFTWFPGHAWRFALCRSCAAQIGWHYEGPSVFWGLSRDALVWDRES